MSLMKIATGLAIAAVLLPAAVAARTTSSSGLDGVYRVSWSEKELLAAGTTQHYAHVNHGVLTLTLRSGKFSLNKLCHDVYTASGGTVSIKQGPGCSGRVAARWSLSGRTLRLHVTKATDPGDSVLFGGKPWRKIA